MKALESLDAGNENREFHNMFQMLMRLCYLRNVKDLKRWSEVVAGYGREKERRMLTYFHSKCVRTSCLTSELLNLTT